MGEVVQIRGKGRAIEAVLRDLLVGGMNEGRRIGGAGEVVLYCTIQPTSEEHEKYAPRVQP